MLTNFPTAKFVKSNEITKPDNIIEPITIPIFINSDVETISGIAPLKPAKAAENIALAMTPAHIPCFAAVARNGRLM